MQIMTTGNDLSVFIYYTHLDTSLSSSYSSLSLLSSHYRTSTNPCMNAPATIRARALIAIFIAEISRSTSSKKVIIKSMSLDLIIVVRCACVTRKEMSYPSTGFRRKMMNLSARCIMNLDNLPANNLSNSSLCLMRTEMRTLLIEGSINTDSRSERVMIKGCSSSSFELLSSISGRLCRSTVCEGKSRKQRAASRVARMQFK